MARANANALYVLRLVLGGAPGLARRQFSAAVLTNREADTPSSSSTSTSAALASSTASDFLESDEAEYDSAESLLPSRFPESTVPHIPWPTVFDHTGGSRPAESVEPRPCDILARLVAENRLEAARKVYDELTALHSPILDRKLYLDAAVASLAPTANGREAFLFWLNLYPNRPAMNNNPKLKEIWNPIAFRILADHLSDTDFIAQFLTIAGKKGLLPTLLPLFIRPLTTVTRPNVSETVLDRAVTAYVSTTKSPKSSSRRAKSFANRVDHQITSWWNLYLRSVSLNGWDQSARALLYSPPDGVRWTAITRTVVLQQGLVRQEAATAAAQQREIEERENPLLGIKNKGDELPWRRRILNATSRDKLPTVLELALIQSKLLDLNRTSLLERFKRRFVNSNRTSTKSRVPPSVAEMWWVHAEIMRLANAEKHEEAVAWFRKHFLWIGLPPLSAGPNGSNTDSSSPRLVPTIRVLTTIIPSVLELEGNESAYHRKYLANLRQVPPILKPTEFTHLAFVRTLLKNHKEGGPVKAIEFITTAIQAGYNPGLPSWGAVIVGFQARGQTGNALQLLSTLENRMPLSGTDVHLPAPSARTYIGLIHTAALSGHESQAKTYLQRFKRFIAETSWQGRPVTGEDKQLLRVAKKMVEEESRRPDDSESPAVESAVEEKVASTGL